jgi:hypothetical protein
MFKASATVIAFAPSSRTRALAGAIIDIREQPHSGSRFTPLLSRRQTWLALKRKAAEARTFSAICFPGWERG